MNDAGTEFALDLVLAVRARRRHGKLVPGPLDIIREMNEELPWQVLWVR